MQLAKVRSESVEQMGSLFDLGQAYTDCGAIMDLTITPEELSQYFCDEKRAMAFYELNSRCKIYDKDTGKICPIALLRAMNSLRHNFFHLVLAEDTLRQNACDPELDHYELKPHLKKADDKHKGEK